MFSWEFSGCVVSCSCVETATLSSGAAPRVRTANWKGSISTFSLVSFMILDFFRGDLLFLKRVF